MFGTSPFSFSVFSKMVLLCYLRRSEVYWDIGLCPSLSLPEGWLVESTEVWQLSSASWIQMSLPSWLSLCLVTAVCICDFLLFLHQAVGPALPSASLCSIKKGGNFRCPAWRAWMMDNQQSNPTLYPGIFSHTCSTPAPMAHWVWIPAKGGQPTLGYSQEINL